MGDKETLATLAQFAGRNLVENLKFIPAGKWDWKPAPEAMSAKEIINHVLGNYAAFNGVFGGPAFTPVDTIEAAQAALLQATADYAVNVRTVTPEQLDQPVELGPGIAPPLRVVNWMAVIDIYNHHGQINYIQSLLGDADLHFDTGAFELLT